MLKHLRLCENTLVYAKTLISRETHVTMFTLRDAFAN